MLDGWQVRDTKRGLEFHGPTGPQLLSSLSDGYRSTTQRVLDFLAWQMMAGRFTPDCTTGGVLLIDEIEQHLHPRWQRYILHRIREQFPSIQVIATSHTPLVVAGTADLSGAQLLSLVSDTENEVHVHEVPRSTIQGRRADQILIDAFQLWTSKSPGSVDRIDRYAALLGQSERSTGEEKEMQMLKGEIKKSQIDGSHKFDERVEEVVNRVLDELVKEENERIAAEPEVRRQLYALLHEDSTTGDAHDQK